jgi:peptidoglycan/LPS O-acetylase OafA/YrhL
MYVSRSNNYSSQKKNNLQQQSKNLNYEIAILRSMAIIFVLGYHFAPGKLPWGFVGVDIFFVISGFLMTKILIENNVSEVVQFYKNRFRRIYPALLIALFLCLLIGYQFLLNDEYTVLLKSISYSLMQVQNIYEIFQSGYFLNTVNFRPLLHLWSLGVEFQFYLLFPFLLIAGKKLGLKFSTSIFCIFIISLVLCFILASILGDGMFFFPLPRFWEFLSGGFCYLFIAQNLHLTRSLRGLFLFLSGMCILGTAMLVRPESLYPNLFTLLPVGFSCFFVVAHATQTLNKKLLSPLIFLAPISFSLYLWHYPLIEFLRQAYGSPTILQRIIILLITFIGAYIVDIYLSPRILRIRNSTAFILGSGAILLLLAIVLNFNLHNIQRYVAAKNSELVNKGNFQVDYKDACEFLTGVKDVEDRCRVGVQSHGGYSYLILGDSHANAFTTVFDALATQDSEFSSYIQIGRGLCPIIPGIGDPKCQEFTRQVLEFAVAPSSPKHVILSGQWPLYVNKSLSSEQIAKFNDGLRTIFITLNNAGKKVVFIDSVPLGALPRSCISRMPSSIPGNCDIPSDKANARIDGYKDLIKDTLSNTSVTVFNPPEFFCNKDKCLVYVDKNILYLDDSHLSRAGGEYLALRSLSWWLANRATQ